MLPDRAHATHRRRLGAAGSLRPRCVTPRRPSVPTGGRALCRTTIATFSSVLPAMSSYCLDVEMFISEVKKYPEIWDVNSEEYRFKSKKQQAWAEIAKLFITDFDHLPEKEKLDVYRKLNGKWRNIRDSFVRHMKRKYGKKGYIYARHLEFLRIIYKEKQNSQSGSDMEGDNDNEEHSDDDDENKLKAIGFKSRKLDILNEASFWESDADESPSTIENLKRKRCAKQENDIEYVDTPFPDPNGTGAGFTSTIEDEDRSFFESLLPAVREFNMDQKLEFRTEVLCLIKGIRSKTSRRHYIKLDPVTGNFD
ncbi:uncharacterized protein LOC142981801 [Anticarsia gemmatalis]|uniref:uncharacterized protein LOC142981801 n=1 Tax=Anticarsia gemmatalis TaxID=129554 RepID=UPI003F760A24